MAADSIKAGTAKAGHPALRLANAIGKVIDVVAMTIAIACIVVMFFSLMLEVIVRYVTHTGLGWPNEIPNLLFPWLIMGGIVLAAQRGAHIAAEAIRGFLSPVQLRILMMGIHLLVAVAFAFLAQLSLQVIAITRMQVFPITGLGQSWAYMSMLFGFWGIALSSLVNLVRVAFAADPSAVQHTDPEHMT
ncbi:TRAP transporter small permease [Frigidibacter sp. MR17.14]|uniref:TRAP transporter small permease n=1 Tax=Frigidibacter sp. MR17.14 TaxID=3126509 RepID=UPI003012B5BF